MIIYLQVSYGKSVTVYVEDESKRTWSFKAFNLKEMNSYDISSFLLNIHWLRTRQQWIQNRATYMMSFKGKFERKILMGWKVCLAPIVAPTNRQVSLNMSFLKLQLVVNYCAIDVFFPKLALFPLNPCIYIVGFTSHWPFSVIAGSWKLPWETCIFVKTSINQNTFIMT